MSTTSIEEMKAAAEEMIAKRQADYQQIVDSLATATAELEKATAELEKATADTAENRKIVFRLSESVARQAIDVELRRPADARVDTREQRAKQRRQDRINAI